MRGVGNEECVRRVVRRYVDTFLGEGWPDEEGHLHDLLNVVERTMCDDREASRAPSWRRLRRALEDELNAA